MEKAALEERPLLVITRTYPAAPGKVWRAWTDPDALRQWWNQADEPNWRAELDVRVGGTELEFRQEPIFDPSARDGWRGALDRLGDLLQEQ